MADIVLHGVTPQPGNVVSVPVAIQYGLAQGGLVVGEPTDVTCPAWNEAGDQGPIAEGSRAHIFIAPSWHYEQTGLGPMISEDDWKLDILSTIQSIKCNNIPLSNFAAKLGNAYCYDYTNPYTRGCADLKRWQTTNHHLRESDRQRREIFRTVTLVKTCVLQFAVSAL